MAFAAAPTPLGAAHPSSAAPRSRAMAFWLAVVFAVRTAVEAVGHNKLRAGLTSLGILFGVSSVIAMLAIGKGAEQEILEQMRLLGTNNVIITPLVEQKEEKVDKDAGRKEQKRFSPGLTFDDARSIRQMIPTVETASAEIVYNTLITRDGYRRSGKAVGVDTTYFRLLNHRLAEGSLFSRQQVEQSAPVAVIGHGVRSRFFTTDQAVGSTIKVGDVWLTVVGVLEDRKLPEQASQKLGIRDANMDVYVPTSTMLLRLRNRSQITMQDVERASREFNPDGNSSDQEDPEARQERLNYHQLDRIVVRVSDAQSVPAVAEIVQRMLTRRHNQVIDFEITVPELLLKQEQRTKTIFNVVLAAIAAISLIVGGIGIMNIMLASILERIKEIGVRRALGATQRNILTQFLSESVMISLAGGIAGILLGATLSYGIEHFAKIRTIVSPVSVVVAFGVSMAVGLVFGIVPAWRAAKQDPVVCLRYE